MNYQEAYYRLFNAVSDCILLLQQAQQDTAGDAKRLVCPQQLARFDDVGRNGLHADPSAFQPICAKCLAQISLKPIHEKPLI